MNVWEKESQDKRHERLSPIGETRWWAKHDALKKVYGAFGHHEKGLYVDLLALSVIRDQASMKTTVRVRARSFTEALLSCTNDASGGIERLHHPTASRALWNIPALNTESAMLIRSPHRKVFQLHFDSCTDTVTRKVVEIHKSELLVSSSSKVSLLISIFLQKWPAVKVTTVKPQGFITSNTALSLTCRTSGEMDDPLALLVNSEQAESERISDVSVCDVTSPGASPPPSSKAGSETVRDTLENRSTSSQETSSSSSSPLNDR
ncbi:hypothetical protein MHYP_G00252270 [Metynnis hypsauchen]